MTSTNSSLKARGFTLLELIMVMLILSISAAIIVPSLGAFASGRSGSNAATQIIALSRFARTQAVSDGAIYRLALDPAGGTCQLLTQQGGAFVPLKSQGDFGDQYTLPTGVTMNVNITPQPNTLLIPPTDQTQTTAVPEQPAGKPIAQANSLVLNQHQNGQGQYVEFEPNGRVDPVLITLTDRSGRQINLGCASSTEQIHVLTPGEMQ